MFCLYVQAPFAVFRTFNTGSFRPTAAFITPSAAYGLLLNLAGIEMRDPEPAEVMTLIKTNLPKFRLALGALALPTQHSAYQQLHNYPVGTSGQDHAKNTYGSKYNITPVRRAFLTGLKAYLCVDGNDELVGQIRAGLRRESIRRYGLPFLGDNNFLPDRLDEVEKPGPAFWYVPLGASEEGGLPEHISRLSIKIDRKDMSRSTSALFAPTPCPLTDIPEAAWQEVGY